MTDKGLQSLPVVAFLRLIPSWMRGKGRLAQWLLRGRLSSGGVEVADRIGFRYDAPSASEPVAFHLLISGAYEPEMVDFMRAQLLPGDVFVDVGANIGVYTLPCARAVGPEGRVLAIEASLTVIDCLRRNIAAAAARNVRAHFCAACDSDGEEMNFYEAPSTHFGMGSMGPQFGRPPVKVAGRTLDSLLAQEGIQKVRAMKVDVEGYEEKVFTGAEKLLRRPDAPLILFEFVDWAEKRAGLPPGSAQKKLLEYGYRIWKFERYVRGGAPLEGMLTRGFSNLVASKSFRA